MTLIAIAANYLDPENYSLDELKVLARRDDDDEEVRVFKSELRQALRDPSQLPGDELFESVEYSNGSDERFLRWLWHELYGDEPSDASVLTKLKALPEPYTGRLHWKTGYAVRAAADAGEWDKALQMLLAGLAESEASVSPAENAELIALMAEVGLPAAAVAAFTCIAAGSPHSSSSSTG